MKITTFGELLLRLSPDGYERLFQSHRLNATFGGCEANVAVSLADFGADVAYVTRLPENPVGRAAIRTLRARGVDTEPIVLGGDRVGIYFLEKGAGLRGSRCVYDRAASAIATAARDDFDWEMILRGADYFHFSGITPALGGDLPEICLDACKAARKLGVKVSCDLNYRSKLWSKEDAAATMERYCEYIDLLIANTGSVADVLGIVGVNPRPYGAPPDRENLRSVARALTERYSFGAVALSMRTTHSAGRNSWSGMLYRNGVATFAREYELEIVDRVGGGDSFAAGLLYGLSSGWSDADVVGFATAASALKHTIEGDFNEVSTGEVLALMQGDGSGKVQR